MKKLSILIPTYNQDCVLLVDSLTSQIDETGLDAEIIVLDDGEAVGIGTHEELLQTCGVYKEIYSSQFKKEAV